MKTSINFKAVKSDSEIHNFRHKMFSYIRKDLIQNNEYWQEEKIAFRLQKIENYCKEKSGRKLQKNAMPIREAVVVIKENTTMNELKILANKLKSELGIEIFQIAIHKDEGHYDLDTGEWKPNFHAHFVADWQDKNTGKTLKHKNYDYSKMQDLAAECLGMERGNRGSKIRLEAIDYKLYQKIKDYKLLLKKIDIIINNFNSKKYNEVLVFEKNNQGKEEINAEKTIEKLTAILDIYQSNENSNKLENSILKKQLIDYKLKLELKNNEIKKLEKDKLNLIFRPDYLNQKRFEIENSLLELIIQEFKSSFKDRTKHSSINESELQNIMIDITNQILNKNNIYNSDLTQNFINKIDFLEIAHNIENEQRLKSFSMKR